MQTIRATACRHGFAEGSCAICGSDVQTEPVYVSGTGTFYHRERDCALMLEGKSVAEAQGKQLHDVQRMTLGRAQAIGRVACPSCRPPE